MIALQSEIAENETGKRGHISEKLPDWSICPRFYEIATGELGMIQPVDNQVYKYDNKKSGIW